MKYIIDTDPGVDDALALMYAKSTALPIDSITTVYGNASIKDTTRNALTITELLDWDVPVYAGCGQPLDGKAVVPQSHGDNGLGGYTRDVKKNVGGISAVDYLIRILKKSKQKEVVIICFGPTTNVATVAVKRPDLLTKIKNIVVLGGVIGEKGNMTPYSEFNVLNDPTALCILLDTGCDITLIPINICRKVIMTRNDLAKINDPNLIPAIKEITDVYLQYYTSSEEYAGFSGGVMYDLLAIMQVTDPSFFSSKKVRISVNTSYDLQRGRTMIVNGLPNARLVTQVNARKVQKQFFRSLNSPYGKK